MRKRLFLRLALAALLGVGMYGLAAPMPAAQAAPAQGRAMVLHSIGASAMASFLGEYTTSSGQSILVETMVFIFPGSTEESMQPTEVVSIIEHNNVTGAQLNGAGEIPLPEGATFDTKSLTSAFLPAVQIMISPTGDNPGAFDPYLASVGSVTWTGVGAISRTTQTIHTQTPGVVSSVVHLFGKSRSATAEIGPVSYTSPLTGEGVMLTELVNSPGPSAGIATELDLDRMTAVIVFHDTESA